MGLRKRCGKPMTWRGWNCAGAFQAHMASKRHVRAAVRAGCGSDEGEQLARIVWADAVQRRDDDAETHGERLVRLQEVRYRVPLAPSEMLPEFPQSWHCLRIRDDALRRDAIVSCAAPMRCICARL
jgi:hypothetical protein